MLSDIAAPMIYWTTIESSLAIIAANLPTLRPLFRHLSPKSLASSFFGFSHRSARSPKSSDSDSDRNSAFQKDVDVESCTAAECDSDILRNDREEVRERVEDSAVVFVPMTLMERDAYEAYMERVMVHELGGIVGSRSWRA